MPVSAIIPIVEDYREVILPAGYADQIRHSLIVGGYIYYFCGFPLGQMLKINKNDFTDRTVLTFPNDNKHRVPLEMCHAGGVLYCLFRNVDTNDVPNFKFTIGRVQTDPFAILSDFVDVSATYIVQNGSITTDGTSLYVIVGTATLYATRKILKYAISGGAPTVADVTGFGSCHCVRYSGGKLYLTGADFPGATFAYEAHAARMTTGLVIEQTATWEVTDGEFSENEFGISADHIWVSDRSLRGIVKKFQKSDLAIVTDLPTSQLARSTQMTNDGRDLWVLFENGRGVRFNPSSNAQAIYALNDGQGFQSELVGDGTYLWTGWNQNATKIARYHIPPADTTPPQTVITAPARNALISGTTMFTAFAQDNRGMSAVEFYWDIVNFMGRVPATTPTQTTYNLNFDLNSNGGVINGLRFFSSRAIDIDGNISNSQLVPMTVSGSPNPAGVKAWISTQDAPTADPRGIAVDASGNVYTVGEYSNTPDFGTGDLPSAQRNVLLVKYNSSGVAQWVKTAGINEEDVATGVAVDSAGNVFITGHFFSPTIDFGDGTGTLTRTGAASIFVVKYDPSGVAQWAKKFSSTISMLGGSVAVNSVDEIIVTAQFQQNATFGGITVNTTGSAGFAVARLLVDGSVDWARGWGGAAYNTPWGMTLDSEDNVLVTGSFIGTTNLGGGSVTGTASITIFIAKYSGSNGDPLWAKTAGTSGTNQGYGIAVNLDTDQVFACGGFAGNSVNFDPTPGSEPINGGIYLVSYNSAGTFLWQRGSDATNGIGFGLAADTLGNLIMVGQTSQSVFFAEAMRSTQGGLPSAYWSKVGENVTTAFSAGRAVIYGAAHALVAGWVKGTVRIDGTTITAASVVPNIFTVKWGK